MKNTQKWLIATAMLALTCQLANAKNIKDVLNWKNSNDSCPYFSEVYTGDVTFRKSMDEFKNSSNIEVGWANGAIETPSKTVILNSKTYAIFNICEPHNCMWNDYVLIYEPINHSFFGLHTVDESKILIGNPDNDMIAMLRSYDDPDSQFSKMASSNNRDVKYPLEFYNFDSFSSLYSQVQKHETEKRIKIPVKIEIVKGKFEKTDVYEIRVTQEDERYQQAMREYENKYNILKNDIKSKTINKSIEIYFGKPVLDKLDYDADKELFYADLKFDNNVMLSVEIKMTPKEAKKFYDMRENVKYNVSFIGTDSSIIATKLEFNFNKKKFSINLDQEILKDLSL